MNEDERTSIRLTKFARDLIAASRETGSMGPVKLIVLAYLKDPSGAYVAGLGAEEGADVVVKLLRKTAGLVEEAEARMAGAAEA